MLFKADAYCDHPGDFIDRAVKPRPSGRGCKAQSIASEEYFLLLYSA